MLQVSLKFTTALVNAGDESHPREKQTMDQANTIPQKVAFEAGTGSFEGIEFIVIVFVVNHRYSQQDSEAYSERQDNPVEAKHG